MSNERALTSIPVFSDNISLRFQENQGYDFGRFYRYYKTIDPNKYHKIACINDSNLLINRLDNILIWENIDRFDFWGVVDSYQRPWFSTSEENHHVQSHFLIFNTKAIELLDEYYHSVDMETFLRNSDIKILRRFVIDVWEIGFTQFAKSKNLKIGLYLDSEVFTKRYNIPSDSNISHILYKEILSAGYPFIKKKAIFDEKKRLRKNELNCSELILKFGNPEWALDKLIKEIELMKDDQKEAPSSGLVNKIILHLRNLLIKFDGKQR